MSILRRFAVLLITITALMTTSALSEAVTVPLGSVYQGGSELTAVIRDTGEADSHSDREYLLEAIITSADGNFTQTIRYFASESPVNERVAGFARLEDMNFDGYNDLCLITAAGARNVFSVFALWNKAEGRFDPIMTINPWISFEKRYLGESVALELCNFELLPQSRQIISEVADGYRYRTITVYGWEGESGICEDSVAEVYDAGEDNIGERLDIFATDISRYWDAHYPESWYYGQERVAEERSKSLRYVMLGDVLTEPIYMKVANTDWVYLRSRDDKSSPAVAKLGKGMEVMVLRQGCGEDGGWVRVLVNPSGEPRVELTEPVPENTRITGYIWHSFLESAK